MSEHASPLTAQLQAALDHHQNGRFDAAEAAYRRLMADHADFPPALHYLGMLLHQTGRTEPAIELMQRAANLAPAEPGYWLNLGAVLEAAGRLDAALAAYVRSRDLEPDAPDTHFNCGVMQLALQDWTAAAASFDTVLRLDPRDAEAYANRGAARLQSGAAAAALDDFEAALEHAPQLKDALAGRAQALRELGRTGEAVDAFRAALRQGVEHPAVLNNFANVLRDLGQLTEARACLQRAAGTGAVDRRIALNLAEVEYALGELPAALSRVRALLETDTPLPEPGPLSLLKDLIAAGAASMSDAALESDLRRLWSAPAIDPQPTARVLGEWLVSRYHVSRVAGLRDGDSAAASPLADELLDRAAGDDLLLALLERGLNVDGALEPFLRRLRASLLRGDLTASPVLLGLAAAVGLQCFANEYLWLASDSENARLAALEERLTGGPVSQAGGAPAPRLAALIQVSMYRSAAGWLDPEDEPPASLLESIPALRAWWQRIAVEPGEEAELRQRLRALAPVEDQTSREVQAQYEDNPYPRWLVTPQPASEPLHEGLVRRFGGSGDFAAPQAFQRVLVAGCGTGFEPILLALSEPQARIVALDLSAASLAYAARRSRDAGLERIEFIHGDLLQARALDERFDLIVSTGVLHHLGDPMAGWRALRDRLCPEGMMRISLYSERARASVVAARERLAADGRSWSPAAAEAIRQTIFAAKAGDPLAALQQSEDLYAASAVRDLLFHVSEHRFTPAQVAAALDQLSLRFVGFEGVTPPVRESLRRELGLTPEQATLEDWERFEVAHPNAFPGMLQFWCQAS